MRNGLVVSAAVALLCVAAPDAKSGARSPPAPRTQPASDTLDRCGKVAAKSPLGIPASRGYRLVKNWDFLRGIRSEAALRAEFELRYVYDGGKLDHLGDEWSRYRNRENHVFGPDGLALVARAEGDLAPDKIESGMLRSRWTGRHGVYEICMRSPVGRGFWPAFWLNPEDGRWPPEIDVVEIVNDRDGPPARSFHFLHGKGIGAEDTRVSRLDREGAYSASGDFSSSFHLFSVEWTPSRVRHFVDGALVADREFRWVHDDGADAGPAHVLVNLAVGGKWPGPPTDKAVFPGRLRVAFMRVWQP